MVVIGFASPIHRDRLGWVMGKLDYLVMDEADVGKVPPDRVDRPPILAILSGGSSRLVLRLVKSMGIREALILAFPFNNSLASALSARSLLRDEKVANAIYLAKDVSGIEVARRIANTVRNVRGLRAVVLGVNSKDKAATSLEGRFGARVEVVPMEAFERVVESSSQDESFIDELSRRLDFTLPRDKVVEVSKIYSAFKTYTREGGVLAINCFPYLVKHGITPCLALAMFNERDGVVACEADLGSMLLMTIFKGLTGHSGWIANVVDVDEDSVYLAHCTISLGMVRRGRVVTHYESGHPYSIEAEINADTVTVASISRSLDSIYAFVGRLKASGGLGLDACRTQARVAVNFDPHIILKHAPANHHVLVPGNIMSELEAVAELLGIRLVRYGSLS